MIDYQGVFIMEILKAEHLFKEYGKKPNIVHALNDISISVQNQEFVSIVGTSGSGKSTLLHMLGGLDRPRSPQKDRICISAFQSNTHT